MGMNFESRPSVRAGCLERHNQKFIEARIDGLVKEELNGRQIKNILKTAQLLAMSKDSPLNVGHVQTITKLKAGHAYTPAKNK